MDDRLTAHRLPLLVLPNPRLDRTINYRLQEEEQEAQMKWANEFNSLLVTRGQDVCAMGYEGFLRTGSKGAVAVS